MLTSAQLQAMVVIMDTVYRYRGLPWPLSGARDVLAMAMVANAYAESALDPAAVGDNGDSIGLFQCHTVRGAGRGHDREQLMDPRYNTMVILGELVDAAGMFKGALLLGTDVQEVTRLFSTHVERPANQMGEERRRTDIAERFFGELSRRRVQVPR